VAPEYLKASEDGIGDPDPWLQARRESYRNIEQGVRERLLERSAQNGAAIQLNDYQCCDKFDLMREVEDISLPTHAICGTADAMTPPRYTSYLVEKIPGAQSTLVDGASHWVQLEKHREVNKAIETFVATLE
ncbi:MAG: alpha/beta hydrolase, partial [Dehalococcoidia bacterium]|nr:alpha/beta hydrolase [Dehalococcoidia bacterium]